MSRIILILFITAAICCGAYYLGQRYGEGADQMFGEGEWPWQKDKDKAPTASAPTISSPTASGAPTPPPAPVTILGITPADVPLVYEYAGRTSGSREVEIRARVSGILQKRAYTEGQAVSQGDVLFEIDPAPYKAALAQAQARFNQTDKDWKRAQVLLKQKALSAREHDDSQAAYEQSKAALETAQINLGYTTVTAPINGITSKESLSEGSLIVADNSLLTRLVQLDPIYIDFAIPDGEALEQRRQIAAGATVIPEDGKLRAEIRLGDGSLYPEQGTLNFTDSIIDPQTGSVNSRAVVPNFDSRLIPGQFVRVVVKGMVRKNAIAIPDQAIMQGPKGPFVYTVDDARKAVITPVKLGNLNNKMRLIESGLKEDDRVIVEGMIKVKPDMPVTVGKPDSSR